MCNISLWIFCLLFVCCNGQALFENVFDQIVKMLPDRRIKEVRHVKDEYDFVIIGAGSGGSVMANRLSEIPEWNILLLEAGKLDNPITDIPISAAMMQSTGILMLIGFKFYIYYILFPNKKSLQLGI